MFGSQIGCQIEVRAACALRVSPPNDHLLAHIQANSGRRFSSLEDYPPRRRLGCSRDQAYLCRLIPRSGRRFGPPVQPAASRFLQDGGRRTMRNTCALPALHTFFQAGQGGEGACYRLLPVCQFRWIL